MQYKITAKQKQWREDCRALGCIITGRNDVEMHHLYGASVKKKYNFQTLWIGQEAQIALCKDLHDQVKTPEFRQKYTNSELFRLQCDTYVEAYASPLHFSDDIYNAIL